MSHDPSDGEIAARLAAVKRRIEEATALAGREAGSVRLLAVSKTKSVGAIHAAYAAGQREFGESYAQELGQKAEELRDLEGIRWHFIGRLQRNKARAVVQAATTVHTLDRVELVAELGRRATAIGVSVRALVEVNVAGEASKGGCAPDEVGALLAAIAAQPSLTAVGLMTIPPETPDPEGARPFFAALRDLRDRHGGAAALPELSMGMTHDFVVAVAEGATLVRVGTAIFGARG